MSGKLFFIGTGLGELSDLSLKSLRILKNCDIIYVDAYTNFFNISIPEELSTLDLKVVSRKELEDKALQILEEARTKRIAILVPGDPFLATTHVTLRMEATKLGIQHEILHNASIFSAAPSVTGLSAYRFGKVATIPFPENRSTYPYDVCLQNIQIDAHTLFLLDIDVKNDRFLSVVEGLEQLLTIEKEKSKGVVSSQAIFIGLAKIGTAEAFIKVGTVDDFLQEQESWQEKGAPQTIIRCANHLHFAEKDALKILWNFNGV